MDLDGSDTTSEGSIEHGKLETTDFDEVRAGECEDNTEECRAGSEYSGTEGISAGGSGEQNGEENLVNNVERWRRSLEDKGYLEGDLEAAVSPPGSSHHDIDCVLDPSSSPSSLWRWGPGTTSEDAAKFFQRML